MKKISNGYLPLVLVLCLLQTQSAFATMSWMVTDIRPLANSSLYEQEPRFNSDGTLVAYRALYAPHSAWNSDICVVALDGFNGSPVLSERAGEYAPSFAPDGRITYARRDRGSDDDDIWVIDKDGYDRHLLINGPGSLEQTVPYWHPSGARLAYNNEYANDRSQIYIAAVVDDGPLRVNPIGPITGPADGYSQGSPVYSRSGDKIAYTNYATGGGIAQAWVMDENGANKQPIGEGGPAFWWCDDSRLGYSNTSGEVWLYNFATGEHEPVYIDSDPAGYKWDRIGGSPDLSPDCKWLVFQGVDGHLWIGEVPEPGTVLLVGLGGLVLRRRRR